MSFVRRFITVTQTTTIVFALALFVGIGPAALAEDTAQPNTTTPELVETQTPADTTTDTSPTVPPTEITDTSTVPSPADTVVPVASEDQTLQTASNEIPLVPQEPIVDIALTTDNTMSNTGDQTATTGDTEVISNDDVEAALTGDADNTAAILNDASTYQNLSGNEPILYTVNVMGDQTGDVTISPEVLGITSPLNLTNPTTIPLQFDANTIHIISNNLIDNSLSQGATTGNADVLYNDDVGNVGTGDATNNADIINLANTIIGTGSNFIGMINVFGDFQGNILLPSTLLNYLTTQPTYTAYADVTINNNTDITNSADMNAVSGLANVTDNDDVAGVATGSSANNLLVKNSVGQYVFSQNAFLVLISVGGNWYGLILGAPQSNGAVLSLDPGTTTPTSANESMVPLLLTIDNNTVINNQLAMNAKTGNATVTGNDDVGYVSTGNATNNARIMNVSNTIVSLAQWFGILFINILGNWYGSVALYDTNPSPAPATTTTEQVAATSSTNSNSSPAPQPTRQFNRFSGVTFASASTNSSPTPTAENTAILGANDDAGITRISTASAVSSAASYYWLIITSLFGASMIGGFKAYQLRMIR